MQPIGRIVIFVVGFIGASAALVMTARPAPEAPPPAHAVVLAELFTSEGCSSCPPADALVRRLVADQPVAGVEIVALGSHVDYWDRLGWRDPFSSPIFSQRQERYAADVFRLSSPYTPQLVVDGYLESVGSDEAAVRRNILEAARQPKAVVEITAKATAEKTAAIDVSVRASDGVKRTGVAEIFVALTEDGLTTQVKRGENGGRTLAHSAVVRLLRTVGRLSLDDRVASSSVSVPLQPDWNAAHLRAVAFVQEQKSGRIVGVAGTMLAAHESSSMPGGGTR